MPLIFSRINQGKERNRLLSIRTKGAYRKIDLELATKEYIYLLEGAPPVSHRRCHHVGCLSYRNY